MQGPVGRGKGEISKKRRIRLRPYHPDKFVGKKLAAVAIVPGQAGDELIVHRVGRHRIRIRRIGRRHVGEMTGSAGDQGEGLIKPEGIGTRVVNTSQVPFARQVGSVTRLTQQRGHGGYPGWQGAGIGGGTLLVIRQLLRQRAEAHGVGLLPRQQGSTGG